MHVPATQQVLRFIGRLRWLRGRDRILRAFSNPDTRAPFPFETDFFGKPYSGNLANFIDWSVFYYGAFCGEELHLLADLAAGLRARGKPVHFFDIGANIGHHTLFMSSHADSIFSFEPFSTVRAEMQRKLTHAGVANVTVFPVALGDKTETAAFTPPTGANQGTGTLGSMLPENAAAHTIPVEVVRGDDFFAVNNLPPVSLLKMDVEGFEVNALEGLHKTLCADRPPMLLEIQRGPKGEQIKSLLYPDHLLFEVSQTRGEYILKPFLTGSTEEALVLPAELAGIVRGSNLR